MTETMRLTFVITQTRRDLYRAHLDDDATIVAHGETPMLAIRALADHLDDEDARLDAQPRPSSVSRTQEPSA
ncbi:MAG: hypothetical protein SGJ24_04580 [Chloroflexota bacterium]|nr:hypothetical protein [Chloroflexota bacterium]